MAKFCQIWSHWRQDPSNLMSLVFQVLCLSPTYELALQTGEVASRMSQFAPDLTIRQ